MRGLSQRWAQLLLGFKFMIMLTVTAVAIAALCIALPASIDVHPLAAPLSVLAAITLLLTLRYFVRRAP